MEVKPFAQIPFAKQGFLQKSYIREKERQNWGFAFSHASRSSKSILVALQLLRRLSPYPYFDGTHVGTDWMVGEMVEWLKVCAGIVLIQEVLRNF
jgi:hypothetical protein